MIDKGGAVKMMDFGIARALTDSTNRLTQTAAVTGTAQYISPEQASGETVDARSDVYSLGCVLDEILTGEPPFVGDTPVAVAYQHVRQDPVAPRQRPDATGRGRDAAEPRIQDPRPVQQSDPSVPIGYVINTDPGPDTAPAGGDEITVTVSSGPDQRRVRNCANLPVNDCVRRWPGRRSIPLQEPTFPSNRRSP